MQAIRGNDYEKGILKRMVEGSRNQSDKDGGTDGNRYDRHGSSHESGELGSGGFGFMPCRDSLPAHVTRRPAGSNRIRGIYADMRLYEARTRYIPTGMQFHGH